MKLKVISPFVLDRLYKKGEIIEAEEPVFGLTVPYEEKEEPKTEEKPKRKTAKSKS